MIIDICEITYVYVANYLDPIAITTIISTEIIFNKQMSGGSEFLKTDLFRDIRKLINIIDEVRDYGLDKEISLPRIAVLGTQSSGKSSLL